MLTEVRAASASRIWQECAPSCSLAVSDFFKSMTTYADHRIWQDVYHAKAANGEAVYLKLTVIEDVLIVSFKDL